MISANAFQLFSFEDFPDIPKFFHFVCVSMCVCGGGGVVRDEIPPKW